MPAKLVLATLSEPVTSVPAVSGLKFLITDVADALVTEPICTFVEPRMSRMVLAAKTILALE